jgi:hypothetical protein
VDNHTTAIEDLSVLVTVRVKDVRGRLTGPGDLDSGVLDDNVLDDNVLDGLRLGDGIVGRRDLNRLRCFLRLRATAAGGECQQNGQ